MSSSNFDTVISGGTIVDGSGADAFSGDIGIADGKIAAVGGVLTGKQTVDADGALVTPGWVDVHTHFCLLYTSPSPRDQRGSRMPSSA